MGKREIFSLALKSDIPKEKILSIGIEKIKMEVAESFRVGKSSLVRLKRNIRNDLCVMEQFTE